MAAHESGRPSAWGDFRTSCTNLELPDPEQSGEHVDELEKGFPRLPANRAAFPGPGGVGKPCLLGRPAQSVSFDSCRSSASFGPKEKGASRALADDHTKEDSDSGEQSPCGKNSWNMRRLVDTVRSSGRGVMAMTSMPTDMRGPPPRFPLLDAIVRSREFEAAIALVIIANCITMGLEVETLIGRANFYRSAMKPLDNFFAVVFLIELVMRVLVFGWRSYIPGLAAEKCGSVWNLLEAMVVLISCVSAWAVGHNSADSNAPVLQALTILRALRLVRVVRVVSRVKLFHEVWLLLRGLSGSMRVLFWTVVVIFFITYMFAVFGVVLISVRIKDTYEAEVARVGSLPASLPGLAQEGCSEAIERALDISTGSANLEQLKRLHDHTLGIWQWMFTLLQVLTLDSWMSIARPMQTYVSWSWAFFYMYIAIAVFVLMNLVTAIIVENALKSSQKDAEEVLAEKDREKKSALKRCKRLFSLMDEDQNGSLTLEEFEGAFLDSKLKKELEVLDIHQEDARQIFKVMDTGDGVLELGEFFEGITRMQGPAQAKDMFRVLQITQKLASEIAAALPGCSSAQLPGSPTLTPKRGGLTRNVSTASRVSRPQRGQSRSGYIDPSVGEIVKKLNEVTAIVESCDRRLAALTGANVACQEHKSLLRRP